LQKQKIALIAANRTLVKQKTVKIEADSAQQTAIRFGRVFGSNRTASLQ
jgi:hypothetical protein